jgi:YD repeat-containing protein
MADQSEEVAPLEKNAEENPDIISLADIVEASDIDTSLFESKSTEEVEEESEEETEESAEYSEDETETDEPIDNKIEEPVSEDSVGVKKRIGKLIEAKNQAEAEKLLLEEEIKTLKKVKVENSELEEIQSAEELQQRELDAEHLREWLLENPDGGDYEDQSGNEHEVEYDQARKLMAKTDRDLRKNIPLAKQRLQLQRQNNQQALNTFKWLGNQSSPENVELRKILASNPQANEYVKKDPFGMVTMAYAVEGYKAIQQRNQKVTSTNAPKLPSTPNRAKPSVVKGKKDDRKTLFKKAMSGSVEDASSYIEQLL